MRIDSWVANPKNAWSFRNSPYWDASGAKLWNQPCKQILIRRKVFIWPPTKLDLTQGHFIVGPRTNRVLCENVPKCLISSEFSIFGAPQAPSSKLSLAKQVFSEGKAPWDQNKSLNTTHPRQPRSSPKDIYHLKVFFTKGYNSLSYTITTILESDQKTSFQKLPCLCSFRD